MNYNEIAKAIVGEAISRGYTPAEAVATLATALQESNLNERAKHPHDDTWGVFQQDASYRDRMDAMGNIRGFFDRLDRKRADPGASNDIWKNIFWLQQRPSERSADEAWNDPNARRAYVSEIQSRLGKAQELYDQYGPQQEGKPMAWRGDPVWLEDVLRPVLGDKLKTLPGWEGAGHGDYGTLWGVMIHHTGNSRESAESIRRGRADLPGPLSNLHIAPDGTVTIVAVGVCWHAGQGAYPGIPTNNANWHVIGIENAWPTIRADGSYNERERWPDAQMISMRDTTGAILQKLGVGENRVIRHQDWAGAAQGKWDAGNLSTAWFQGEVGKWLRGEFGAPSKPPVTEGPVQPPILAKPPNPRTDRVLLEEVWEQLRGLEGKGWPQLGDKTLVDSLAELHRKIDLILKAGSM